MERILGKSPARTNNEYDKLCTVQQWYDKNINFNQWKNIIFLNENAEKAA